MSRLDQHRLLFCQKVRQMLEQLLSKLSMQRA
jgi:hypothetical protein